MPSEERTDDRARKPVFAVVMMVTVTVVLVGTVGVFLVGTGTTGERPPRATFEVDVREHRATVVHAGGETFEPGNTGRLEVVVDGGSVVEGFDVSDGVSSGDRAVVRGVDSGDVVRVVWHAPDGERGSVVLRYEVR